MAKKWYVIQTYSGYENKVKAALQERIRQYTMEEKFGEILGVHIIGADAFELIAEAVVAMEAEATVETMMSTIHAHPTLYEAMGDAFNAVYGLALNA